MTDRLTVGKLAEVLHEPQHVLFARVLKTLGEQRTVAILTEALTLEHQGGMWLKDGSRRRTLGGVFLQLCRERTTASERREIFR
jgi:phosphorylated adapter RNA export protein